jgi:DNA-directed RNA polymerase subunit M/transcription elongation factor TFIIS
MSDNDTKAKSADDEKCPACTGSMSLLMRIAHDDRSATIYMRCPACSHLEIIQSPPLPFR